MKNFKFVIPYVFKKVGLGLFLLCAIQLVIMIVFKKEISSTLRIDLFLILQMIAGIALFLIIFSKEKEEDERIDLLKYQSITAGFGVAIFTYVLMQIFELIDFNTTFTRSGFYPLYMGAAIYLSTFYARKKEE